MLGVFMSVCGGGHGGAREGDTGIVNKKQTIADIPFFPHEKWGMVFWGIHNQNGRKKYLLSSFLFVLPSRGFTYLSLFLPLLQNFGLDF
jgi:hypothetical protein